uniref:hypothetical protein n=1 Tax=Pannonibacter indicus TaxID=466044 RepID=UPI0035AE26B9
MEELSGVTAVLNGFTALGTAVKRSRERPVSSRFVQQSRGKRENWKLFDRSCGRDNQVPERKPMADFVSNPSSTPKPSYQYGKVLVLFRGSSENNVLSQV